MSLLKVILLLNIGAALGVTIIYFLPLQDLDTRALSSHAALENEGTTLLQKKGIYKIEEKLAKLVLIMQEHAITINKQRQHENLN